MNRSRRLSVSLPNVVDPKPVHDNTLRVEEERSCEPEASRSCEVVIDTNLLQTEEGFKRCKSVELGSMRPPEPKGRMGNFLSDGNMQLTESDHNNIAPKEISSTIIIDYIKNKNQSESSIRIGIEEDSVERHYAVSTPDISNSMYCNESSASPYSPHNPNEQIVIIEEWPVDMSQTNLESAERYAVSTPDISNNLYCNESIASPYSPHNPNEQKPFPPVKLTIASPSCSSNLAVSLSDVSFIDSRIEAARSQSKLQLAPVNRDHVRLIQSAAIPGMEARKSSKKRHNSIFHAMGKIRNIAIGSARSKKTSVVGGSRSRHEARRNRIEKQSSRVVEKSTSIAEYESVIDGIESEFVDCRDESDQESYGVDYYESTVEDTRSPRQPHVDLTTGVDESTNDVKSPPNRRKTIQFHGVPTFRRKSQSQGKLSSVHRDHVRLIQSAASPDTALRKRHNSFSQAMSKIGKVTSVRSRNKSVDIASSPRIVHLHQIEPSSSFAQYKSAIAGIGSDFTDNGNNSYGVDYYRSTVDDPRALNQTFSDQSMGIDVLASAYGQYKTAAAKKQSVYYDADNQINLLNRESRTTLAENRRKSDKKKRSSKRLVTASKGKRYQLIMENNRKRSRKQSFVSRLREAAALRKCESHSLLAIY